MNIDTPPKFHVDSKDWKNGFSAVAPFGTYTGGHLSFPELALEFKVEAGDIILFQSHLLEHGNTEHLGHRSSIVMTTHNTVFNYLSK